jgi:hypothetical protein
MAKFKSGESGNPNGRPAGVPNKLTKELKAMLKAVIATELETLPATLDSLPPEKRVDVLCKLLNYVMPKMPIVSIGYGEPAEPVDMRSILDSI